MKEFLKYFEPEPRAEVADWVHERCTGVPWTLNSIVPTGFARYVRILHPAWAADALDPADEDAWKKLRAGWRDAEELRPVKWRDVARQRGRTLERAAQWYDVDPSTQREGGTAGIDPPYEGELTREIVNSTFSILANFGGAQKEVVCGFWEGFNLPHLQRRRSAALTSLCRGVGYVLFRSTLAAVKAGWLAAIEYSVRKHGAGTGGFTPNLMWPTTRAWYMAVDFNLRSTYVGGPEDLILSMEHAAELETVQAMPGDEVS